MVLKFQIATPRRALTLPLFMYPSFRLPVLPCLALCALSLPLWLAAQPSALSAARGGFAGPAAGALSLDVLKTALTLTDTQVAAIAPLLDLINKGQQDLTAAQLATTGSSGAAIAAITAILTDAQKTQFAALANPQFPARGGARGGAGRGRGGAGPAANTLPYLSQPALGGLSFDKPLAIVTAPGEPQSLYILEKENGQVIRIPDVTKPERVTVLDLSAEIGNLDNERGLLAIAFHPDYQKNHLFYLWFTASNADGSQSVDRLARFTMGSDGKADPKSEQPLISQVDRANNHNGGQLAFGPDGYLYLSMGDEGGSNGEWQNTQLIDKNFFAGMIRIDVDKRPGSLPPNPHPAVHAGTYTVPADNPWVGAKTFNGLPVDPAKVRTEYWAVGLRNPWRWSFDPVTGLLWEGDVGQERIEEVNLIHGGGNYGWNFREGNEAFVIPSYRGGRTPYSPIVPPPPDPNRVKPDGLKFDEPVFTYFHPGLAPAGDLNTGNSITGGIVYRGKAIPALAGHYIFADYSSGLIWALSPVTADKEGKLTSKVTVEIIARRSGIVSFAQDPVTGDLLVANISGGTIERLVTNPNPVPVVAAPMPPAANP